jgi:hypothetical protein
MKLRKRAEEGSIFIVVIAAVAIAAMIAVSYLLFMNDSRERAGREMDQAKQQVALEGTLLKMKQAIADQAKNKGAIDLSGMQTNGFRLTWDATGDTGSQQLAPVSGWPGVGDAGSPLKALDGSGGGDPFKGAGAQILRINVEGSAETLKLPRLPNKIVTVTPTIDVRQIPVSQFTAFGNSLVNIDATNFGGDAGRIYGQEGITVNGDLTTSYPIISGRSFDGTGSIRFTSPSGQTISFSPQSEAATSADDSRLLADARTSLDSFVVTPAILPLDVALIPGNSSTQTGGWDLQTSIDQSDVQFEISGDGKGSYSVRATGPSSQWFRPADPKSIAGDQSKKPQSCCCVAKDGDGDLQGKIVIGFNYKAISDTIKPSIKEISFVVKNVAASGATLLIRGASNLEASPALSIVTPHNVSFEGDFNNGVTQPPASVMTSQVVGSVPLHRGDPYFGFVQ